MLRKPRKIAQNSPTGKKNFNKFKFIKRKTQIKAKKRGKNQKQINTKKNMGNGGQNQEHIRDLNLKRLRTQNE